MLTKKQYDEYEANGFVVVPQFLPAYAKPLEKVMDELQGKTPYSKKGRWDMRNCLPSHPIFLKVLTNKKLVNIALQCVPGLMKCLGSHTVKMQGGSRADALTLPWHRDGGQVSLDLEDPLPPMFIKTALCVSGSSKAGGGELLVVPGSHRLVGDLAIDPKNGQPFGVTRVLVKPGDLLVFDWRLWHAVSPNASKVVRRMLYFTFGKRWMMPMDYVQMPQELLDKSSEHRQLLGGSSSQLGYYLPTEEDVPLRPLSQDN